MEKKKQGRNKKQEIKRQESTQGEYADLFAGLQAARGGVAPRQKNRIRHQGE